MGRSDSDRAELGELGLHQLPGQLVLEEDLEAERWYIAQPEWPGQSNNSLRGTKEKWSEVAGEALSAASRMFEKRASGSSGEAALRALGKEKTVGDKIAAFALAIQESPIYRLDELHTLLSFAQKKGRQERGQAMDALKDLFINDLLPDGRRLMTMMDRNFFCSRNELTKRHLIYALFESELKTVYREFIQVLGESGQDSVQFFKQKVVKLIFDLLIAKPENEKMLLSMLVNKLGDPDRKVSSTASYNIARLIEVHHPQMRLVVVQEVEQMLLRPNINRQAQYYAICFLNQISFNTGDTELARNIVRIYLEVFSMCLAEDSQETSSKPAKPTKVKMRWRRQSKKGKKKQEEPKKELKDETKNSRLMAALLLGVNRAFPYTNPEQDDAGYDKYYNSLFRVAHADSFGPATQALALLLQVSQTNSLQNDRLYRALYSRIYDAAECSEKIQASFLNVLFKAMKSDTNTRRIKAFAKRLLQSGSYGSSGFAGACVIVVSECFQQSQKGLLKSFVSLPEQDDEDEIFFDADKLDDAGNEDVIHSDNKSDDADSPAKKLKGDAAESEEERDSNGDDAIVVEKKERNGKQTERYDPRKRDPLFAGAEKSSLWEAVGLSAHYHPSVSMFAKVICQDMKGVRSTGDPLRDYSLVAFLDRFCYKRAKNRVAKSLYGKRSSRYRDDPVANSVEFQEFVKSGHVQEDDKFLMKFFEKNPDRVKAEVDDDEVVVDSDIDSEEEAFEQAMQEEMKRLGADDGLMAGHMPDIDELDEDETKAFDQAFENEMVDSDNESDDGNDKKSREVSLLPSTVDDEESGENDDVGEDDEANSANESKKRGRNRLSSAFAAAEDYEEAIDMELKEAEAAEEGEGLGNEVEEPVEVRPKRKRDRGEAGKRPSKKRRERKRGGD